MQSRCNYGWWKFYGDYNQKQQATSKMIIIGGWGASWASMHCWFNVLSRPWTTAGFVPWAWWENLCTATSLVKEATTATHTLGLNFTMKSWASLGVSLCMAHTWSELNYCVWFDGIVCEHRVLVCHGPQSHLVVVELDSEGSIVTTFTQNIRALAHVQIWNVHAPSYPFVQYKFLVYGLAYWTYTFTQLAMQSR